MGSLLNTGSDKRRVSTCVVSEDATLSLKLGMTIMLQGPECHRGNFGKFQGFANKF